MTSFRKQWGVINSEDTCTALVFGFFRHAPAEVGINPWLRVVLEDESASRPPLAISDFWPRQFDGPSPVIPDLCFRAKDQHGDLVVIVEAKRRNEEHHGRQLRREVAAARAAFGARRVMLITVGARRSLADRSEDLSTLEFVVQHRHVSWADIGRFLLAVEAPWKQYAHDIAQRLQSEGLMRHPTPPSIAIDPSEAFEAVSALTRSARDFLNEIDDEQRARGLGLRLESPNRIERTGSSSRMGVADIWWEQGVVYGCWLAPGWQGRRRVIVGVDLRSGAPIVLAGIAVAKTNYLNPMMLDTDGDLSVRHVGLDEHASSFEQRRAHPGETEPRDYRCNAMPWRTDYPVLVDWVIDQMREASRVGNAIAGVHEWAEAAADGEARPGMPPDG